MKKYKMNCYIKYDKFVIEYKDEIKKIRTICKTIISKKFCLEYISKKVIKIDFDIKVYTNTLKNLFDLKMIKYNTKILNKLTLNKYYKNNKGN